MVKFRLGFTISAETLFSMMSKVLPIDDLHVEEVFEPDRGHGHPLGGFKDTEHLPTHNLKAQIKHLGQDSLMPKQLKPKQPAKQQRRRGVDLKRGINGIIITALSDGAVHRAVDLQPLLKAAGFSENSISSRLQQLKEHGVVRQTGIGAWRLTDPVMPIARENVREASAKKSA
jgi:hypothetical protein